MVTFQIYELCAWLMCSESMSCVPRGIALVVVGGGLLLTHGKEMSPCHCSANKLYLVWACGVKQLTIIHSLILTINSNLLRTGCGHPTLPSVGHVARAKLPS